MKNRLSFWIYLAGLLPLAIWAPSARVLLGDWLSFAAAIAYLLVLRLVGVLAARWLESNKRRAIEQHNRRVEGRKTKESMEEK
jgi:NhaP-type Na+/H+ or K+/H+ antiporter